MSLTSLRDSQSNRTGMSHTADSPSRKERMCVVLLGSMHSSRLAAMREDATRTYLAPGLELLELVVLGQAAEGRAGAHAPPACQSGAPARAGLRS